jgi:hypothetical protein
MEETSALLLPFLYLVLGIPFGFLIASFVHSAVAIPRWFVEHGV